MQEMEIDFGSLSTLLEICVGNEVIVRCVDDSNLKIYTFLAKTNRIEKTQLEVG